ncbi:MAG: ABC transporter permease [Gemmatimonadales bacterium]
MDTLLHDIRYAARRLRHSPTFTLIVVSTLGLGIGANSAIFSVVNTVLLRPLPYRDPGQVVTIFHFYPTQGMQAPVSAPGFKDYRDRTRSFSSVAVESGWRVNLTGIGEPQQLVAKRVSGLFFGTLGVAPALGRPLLADDEAAHSHVVVIGNGLWQRALGGRRDVVGKTVVLNSEAYEIVGVMPQGFVDPFNAPTEVWAPMQITPAQFAVANYTNEYLNLVARLKPGVALRTAAAEMTSFAAQLKKDNPNNFAPDWTLQVRSLADVQTGKIRPALLVLLGAVGFVLLIACANVANLLLARAASRRREIAIRTALGATPWGLIRQLLTESLMLSCAGGALGLIIAYGSIRALVSANPVNLPRVGELAIDVNVVLFTLAVALTTGVGFGLAPALQVWRTNLQNSLKDGSRTGTADKGGQIVRRALVVAEIALALVLLTGGGLLLKSFSRLAQVSPGFDAQHVLTFAVALPPAKYSSDTSRTAFWNAVMPRIALVPGVRSAAGTTVVPFGGDWSTGSYNVEGLTVAPNANGPWGDIRFITPDFFTVMQVPRIAGRSFGPQDDARGILAAVVDDEFVRHYYPGGANPVGKRIYFGNSTPDSTTQYITIVGVVGHTMHEGLDAAPRPQLYLPVAQSQGYGPISRLDLVVRTTGDPRSYVGAVRSAIHGLDRDLPMAQITTMDDLVSASMGQRRLSTVLLGIFSGLALLLASLGIYGVMSYAVAQRTRELGVRVALGATPQSILRLVLRQGTVLTALGAAIGLGGALLLTRLIAAQLYAVKPDDPVTFAGVTLLLLAVAIGATLAPAVRATRIDPIVALREE